MPQVDNDSLLNNTKSPIMKRKRRQSQCDEQLIRAPEIKRYKSDSELVIRNESNQQQMPLIGDFSRPCSLPTVSGREQDVTYISPATMIELLKSSDDKQNVLVIDCRYDYEYLGGHILGAKNCSTPDMVEKQLLTNLQSSRKADIVIFHCEFSQERGPKLLRHLRKQDRALNSACYPALYYPEIYLLKGGYKAFWDYCAISNSVTLCEPQAYKPMLLKTFSKMPSTPEQPKPIAPRNKSKFRKALLFEE